MNTHVFYSPFVIKNKKKQSLSPTSTLSIPEYTWPSVEV